MRTDTSGIAGDQEAMAAKMARSEERLKGAVSRPPSARGAEGSQTQGQKGKKGKGQGKGKQEDSQKGKNQDGKKDDSWQKKSK